MIYGNLQLFMSSIPNSNYVISETVVINELLLEIE